jgi:hypothetical protein
MTQFTKDGQVKTLRELKIIYPLSFGPNTPAELGWSVYVPPAVPPTPEQIRAQRKMERTLAVAAITVTVTSGKVFDGDEDSTSRMIKALKVADLTGATETTWTLADNSIATVTKVELQEALTLAMLEQAALWPITVE